MSPLPDHHAEPTAPRRVLTPAEAASLHDWETFTSRALRLDDAGATRLQVSADVLIVSVAPLHPHSLGDTTPLAMGMRMLRLADTSLDGLDAVVPTAALADRFARLRTTGGTGVPLPPQEVQAAWAGIAPPRGPWLDAGSMAADALISAAEAGIAEVAAGTPAGAGSHAVAELRRRVWSRPVSPQAAAAGSAGGQAGQRGPAAETAPVAETVPAAVAFVLFGLGFLRPGQSARIFTSPSWLRVSTAAGHVLTRRRQARQAQQQVPPVRA